MQQYQDSVTHDNGTPVAGASIRVLTAAGAQATIYSDNGVTVASNPIKAGANGQFSFYAADGNYSLVISAIGHVTRTLTGIVLDSSGSSANIPPAATLDGAEGANIKQGGKVVQTTLAKIAQWISANVRGFGAKGDGTTDDTAAIVSAQTAGDAYLPAGSFSVGASAPDYDVHGPGKVASGGVQSGGAVLSYNPARESIFFAPATYQREVQGINYPPPRGASYIGSSYNTVLALGSKLKDYSKSIRYVVAYGNMIGSSPLTWGYTDAFGGNALAYAGNIDRVVAIGSESLAWFGAPNQQWLVTYQHDWWRKPSDNPYVPGDAGWNAAGLETLFPGIGARIAAFTGYQTDPTQNSYTTTLGRDAGNHIVTGMRNVFAGYQCAGQTFAGSYNVAIGSLALGNMVFGSYNTASGDQAGQNCLDSTNATFAGYGAGRTVQAASFGTFIGDRAADVVTSAAGAVVIGSQAGSNHPVALTNMLVISNDKSTVKPPLVSGDFTKGFGGYNVNPEKVRARLHVRDGDSGSTLVPSNKGILVEGASIAAITLETPATGYGKVAFANPNGGEVGGIEYSHASNAMDFFANSVAQMRLESTATLRPSVNGVGLLGRVAYRWQNVYSQNIVLSPPASVTPANNGDVTFQLTSDTQLTIKVKGSDGTVRSASLTLA
jgi:hypothetical protein